MNWLANPTGVSPLRLVWGREVDDGQKEFFQVLKRMSDPHP